VKGKKGEANSKQAAPITIWGFHENTTNRVYFPAKHAEFFLKRYRKPIPPTGIHIGRYCIQMLWMMPVPFVPL
jgi:hypothetical protein